MKLSTKTVIAILDRWSNECIITDHASRYGEPGYGDDDTTCVVLGNYWCECGDKRFAKLHSHEMHRPHLWEQLADQGVEFEWYDEWTVDYENDKAYRTSPDSYHWQPSFVWTFDGEMLTPDDDLETWIEWATNDHTRALPTTVWGGTDLLGAGFTKYNGEYQIGWSPGQDDDAESILHEIVVAKVEDVHNLDVVFMLDENSQFHKTFSAWWRVKDRDDAENADEKTEEVDA